MLNRRSLLKYTLGASALVGLPFASKGSSIQSVLNKTNSDLIKGPHLSLSKHGNFKGDDNHLWSVLSVPDNEAFLNKINSILDNFSYKSEIKYSTNDRFKIEPAIQILNYISNTKGVQFNMIFFATKQEELAQMSPTQLDEFMLQYYQKLSIDKEEASSLYLKCENRFGPSDKHAEVCGSAVGKNFVTINAKNDRTIQVNNLVGGIVYSFLNGSKVKNENKIKINNFFDKKFAISEQINKSEIVLPSINITKI